MNQNQSATSTELVSNRYFPAAELGRDCLLANRGAHQGTRPFDLLETIYELAIKQCRDHECLDESYVTFSPSVIAEAIRRGKKGNRHVAAAVDPTQNGKNVTKWWKEGRLQDELRAGLEDQARVRGMDYIPWIEKEKGGGYGRTSTYRLTIQEIDTDQRPNHDEQMPEGWVRYFRESARPVFAPLVGAPLGGLRSKLMVAFLVPLLATSALCFWLGALHLLGPNPLVAGRDFVLSAMVAGLIYLLMGHLYRSREMGIVVAGLLASPWNDMEPNQLVSERSDEGRRVMLVKFYSNCGVRGCDGRITVRNGKGPERGRLVGCCDRSPREHIYTFDHVTQVGSPLRTAALVHSTHRHEE